MHDQGAAEVQSIVASLRGQPLDAVTVDQHWFENVPSGEVIGFWLHFRDRPTSYYGSRGTCRGLQFSFAEVFSHT